MTAVYNITMEQGETFLRTLTWKDSTGTPVDLTGYTAHLQVRRSPHQSSVLNLVSPTNITLGGIAGTIHIEVSAPNTLVPPSGDYEYDLLLTNTVSGYVRKLLKGKFRIFPAVTQ